jgi:hypothetical protein
MWLEESPVTGVGCIGASDSGADKPSGERSATFVLANLVYSMFLLSRAILMLLGHSSSVVQQ